MLFKEKNKKLFKVVTDAQKKQSLHNLARKKTPADISKKKN